MADATYSNPPGVPFIGQVVLKPQKNGPFQDHIPNGSFQDHHIFQKERTVFDSFTQCFCVFCVCNLYVTVFQWYGRTLYLPRRAESKRCVGRWKIWLIMIGSVVTFASGVKSSLRDHVQTEMRTLTKNHNHFSMYFRHKCSCYIFIDHICDIQQHWTSETWQNYGNLGPNTTRLGTSVAFSHLHRLIIICLL